MFKFFSSSSAAPDAPAQTAPDASTGDVPAPEPAAPVLPATDTVLHSPMMPSLPSRDSNLTHDEVWATPSADYTERQLLDSTPTPTAPSAPLPPGAAAPEPLGSPSNELVVSSSDLAVAAAVAPPPVAEEQRARRRSLPGFGFWGKKQHAESLAHASISPLPSATQEALAPVVEADAPIIDEKVVPVDAPAEQRKRRKSIKKKPPTKKAPKAEPAPAPAEDTVPIITVEPAQNGHASELSTSPSAAPSSLPSTASTATVAPAEPAAPLQKKLLVKKSEKKADAAAKGVRTLIVGPVSDSASSKAKPLTKSEVNKLKGQLLEPKSATKIIARLRNLPIPQTQPHAHAQVPEAAAAQSVLAHDHATSTPQGPIHAVCLDCTDAEADALHFAPLQTLAIASAASAFPVLRNMRIVSLLETPDLGLGRPIGSGGAGILSGSVPSPAVIADGLMQLSQQLVALGYATSTAVHPSHVGIFPPTDRTSVITYWWGLEVLLPEQSMQFLKNVKSVQNAVLNVLTALSMFNQGVREILPFIRYISQFIDFEWSAIQGQDRGQGVVCAATWVMPAAMVPRPWDFPAAPEGEPTSASKGTQFEFVQPGPVLPELPQLLVTPPTLPRHADAPDADAPATESAIPAAAPVPAAVVGVTA